MANIPSKGEVLYDAKKKELKIGDGVTAKSDLKAENLRVIHGNKEDNNDLVLFATELFLDNATGKGYLGNGATKLENLEPIIGTVNNIEEVIASDEEVDALLNHCFNKRKH